MNYSNIFGRTKRQFDATMNREKIAVTDFFDPDTTYDVFFRENQRSTTPQGKVRFFYAQSTPIKMGTIFVFNGENYIVTSQDGAESNIYFKSLAVKSDMTYTIKTDSGTASIPFVVMSDEWTVSDGTVFSQFNGSVALYTGYNSVVDNIKVNDTFKGFGNYYTVKNTFKNNNLFYLYLEQTVAPESDYAIAYNGATSFDMKDSATYQLSYTVTDNGVVVESPTITYQSSNVDVATVDGNGLMTMLAEGSVDITASCGGATITTSMTITNTTPVVNYTTSISSADTIKVGGSYKTLTCLFADSTGNDITATTITNLTADDFAWTCFIGNTEFTSDSMVVWNTGSSVNDKKIKLASAAENYLGEKLTIKCTVNGVTASKDIEITAVTE